MKKLFVMGFFMALAMMVSAGNMSVRTDAGNAVSAEVKSVSRVDTVKHVVERGETLASIAERYGITEDEIIKLNPEAAQFIYVGMELWIPVVKSDVIHNETRAAIEKSLVVPKSDVSSTNKIGNQVDGNKQWKVVFNIGFGFPTLPDEMDGSCYTYAVTLGGNYNVTESFYAGFRLGYNSSTINMDSPMDVTQKFHFITLPLEAGYRLFLLPDKVSLAPHVGLDMNFAIKGTAEPDGGEKEKVDVGGDVGVGVKLGVNLKLWEFLIRGSYVFPLNDDQKSYFGDGACPEIAIGWEF